MNQALYAHMNNKRKMKEKKIFHVGINQKKVLFFKNLLLFSFYQFPVLFYFVLFPKQIMKQL
jgi:hypothetical protein